MIQVLNVIIAMSTVVWLSSCGSGSKKEEAAEGNAESNTAEETPQTSAPKAGKPNKDDPNVAQGESAQVEVNDSAEAQSLTLSRLGKNKLTWNEVVKAGATYLVFERTEKGSYEFSKPIQSLDDVVYLTLVEKPDVYCYIIRAKTKDQKVTVDSNEICISGNATLKFTAPAASSLVASESMLVTLAASIAGETPITYSCSKSCPDGLVVQKDSGVVSWSTRQDQAGEYKILMKAEAGSQFLEQELLVSLREPFINLSVSTEGDATGEGLHTLKASATSNLQGAPNLSIKQISGPTVSLEGSAGQWTFRSPDVRSPTEFSFEITSSLGPLTRQSLASFTLTAKDHGPVLQNYLAQTIVATESFSLASQASDPDGDTLEFACILNCPRGLSVDSSTGLITWQPELDQAGEATPSIRVTANGQSAVTSLSILVLAPSLQIQFAPITAISSDSVVIQPNVQSNLKPPYQSLITQTSGPQVSLLAQDGQWSFIAPTVYDTTQLSFEIQIGKGSFTTLRAITVQIDPQPIAPSVNVGGDRLSREALTVSAETSPNSKTLVWTANGPGLLTFSAANAASTTIQADTDGIYDITLTATNSWGQQGSGTFRLTWDTTAPQIEVGNAASSREALTRTAQVQGAQSLVWSKLNGPGQLQFSPSDGATTTITADQDGDYEIQLEARDEAGNVALDRFNWSFDKTPPTLTVTAAMTIQTSSTALKATASDDATSIAWRMISGPQAASFSPVNQRDTIVTLGADGLFVIEVSASDALGNTATVQTQVTVDTLPPQITGITLAPVVADSFLNPTEKLQDLPLISSVAVTETNSYSLSYKIIGSTLSCNSSIVYAASIPRSNNADINKTGIWKICVKATDSFNLSSFASTANFTYDTTVVTATVSNLPTNPTRNTQLQAKVAGTSVTHYRSKYGPAASTVCSESSSYSSEAPVATPISIDYSSQQDGLLRLCVIGRTSKGNWQDLTLAYRFDWTLDRVVPSEPNSLSVLPLVKRARLTWDSVPNANSYLIVRAEDQAVTWMPSSGDTYSIGQDIDGGLHQIVGLTSSTEVYDEMALGGQSYHYALYAFDESLNYNTSPARASTTIIDSLGFNKANGFDRLVRVVLPIREGVHQGKILVGGDFLVYQKDAALRLLRLNADLTLDTSFKPTAINNSVYAIAMANDGSIYIGGSFTSVAGKVRNRVAKLNGNTGALDESFVAPGFNKTVVAMALNHDQSRLYVGGSFTALTTVPSTSANRLAALRTEDGGVDSGFTLKANEARTSIGFNSTVWSLASDPASFSVLVGGQFTNYGGVTVGRLVKLDESGEIDSSSNFGSGFNSTILALKFDKQQQLYVGGSFSSYRGSRNYARLVRLKTDGLPDTDFNKGLSTSARFNNSVWTMELDETNAKIYAGGDFTAYGTATNLTRLARLSTVDGTLDSSFAGGTTGTLQALALTDQGQLLGGGNFLKYSGASTPFFFASQNSGGLATNSPSGSTFNSNVFATLRVFDDAQTPSSSIKYFLGGSFTSYNGELASRVVKLDREGNIDPSFASKVTNGTVYAMAWDEANKKLYVGGNFTQVNGITRNRIARLNANGSLDTSFVPDGFNGDVYAMALANNPVSSGKVLYVGGAFTLMGTTATGRFVRLSENGQADSNFVSGTAFDGNVNALAVSYQEDDHSVFVGGNFLKYNSSVANVTRIVKLASDGSIASGFEPGSGLNGSVQALLWMPGEGALYVGGAFSRYQTSIVANRIVKLDNSGGVSSGFNASTGFNSTVFALDYDADNDVIWAGGAFTQFRSVSSGRIAAMLRDGNRLTAFQAPVGFNGHVRSITASYWGVLTGGLGSSYDGEVCGFAARLMPNGTMD